jgi:hypothetical protein
MNNLRFGNPTPPDIGDPCVRCETEVPAGVKLCTACEALLSDLADLIGDVTQADLDGLRALCADDEDPGTSQPLLALVLK